MRPIRDLILSETVVRDEWILWDVLNTLLQNYLKLHLQIIKFLIQFIHHLLSEKVSILQFSHFPKNCDSIFVSICLKSKIGRKWIEKNISFFEC